MRSPQADLRASREVLPGQYLQTWHVPWLAVGVKAGQYVQVRTPGAWGLDLRRPFSVNTFDRSSGEVTLHFQVTGEGPARVAALRPADAAQFYGPLGRGFDLDPRSRHLLLVAGGMGIAGVRSLVEPALAEGRHVALLFGARTAADVYPSSLLPEEVEYVVATEDGSLGHRGPVTDLVGRYEAWADQAFASGPPAMLTLMSRLAGGRDARLGVARLGRKRGAPVAAPGSPAARRKSWLQVALPQTMGCAAGTCLGCVVMGVDGPQRTCREGPVFAANELAWELA